MEQRRLPKEGEVYRHYTGDMYTVVTMAKHAESKEDMVVYKETYGEQRIYVLSVNEFLAPVDRLANPSANQTCNFQLTEQTTEEDGINSVLLEYLEADTYTEKLMVLDEYADMTWDNHLISSMAMAVDIAIDGDSPEQRFEQLRDCLRTMGRFEYRR